MKLGYSILLIYVFSLLNILSVAAQQFEKKALFSGGVGLTNSNGISVADYDLDGDPDLFITASEPFDSTNMSTWNRLLQNDGHGGYSDVTIASQLINMNAQTKDGTNGSQMAGSWGDYDGDGYPDLFISNWGLDELWHNEGDGTFRNVTANAGVSGCEFCYSTNAIWWDSDNDGDLDLYVCDWIKRNRFYLNRGDGSFEDISEYSGLDDRGHTFSGIPIDLDEDGRMDLYVINDISANSFLRNQGENQFINETEQVGLESRGNGMGTDICDVNGDGFYDIYITDIFQLQDSNPFFVSNGDGTFSEESEKLGVVDTGWGWGARFFDADHDLDEDLYIVNGFDAETAAGDRNKFFLNEGGQFKEVSEDLGMNSPVWGMGMESFDYDRDGDIDLLVANRGATPDIYKNTLDMGSDTSNWLSVQLEGTTSNIHGFGSSIKISVGNRHFYRYHSGINVFGQSIKPAHFGLSTYDQVDTLQVMWPSGIWEQFYEIGANQYIHLVEGTGQLVEKPLSSNRKPNEPLTLFPNPFKRNLWVKSGLPMKRSFTFSLFDLMGRRVHQERFHMSTDNEPILREAAIKPGIYFYKIVTEDSAVVKRGKLIKE